MFKGILVHHTAGPRSGDDPSWNVIVNGRAGLPGPLANYYISRSGEVRHVTDGRANHGGPGSGISWARIIADLPPLGDARDLGYADNGSHNAELIGIEVEHSGHVTESYGAQIPALVQLCAELCLRYGWTANRVWHHREWTRRKVDMSYRGPLREMIAEAMNPQPQPTILEETIMAALDEAIMFQDSEGTVWLAGPWGASVRMRDPAQVAEFNNVANPIKAENGKPIPFVPLVSVN